MTCGSLAHIRGAKVIALARSLGVNLRLIRGEKKKTRSYQVPPMCLVSSSGCVLWLPLTLLLFAVVETAPAGQHKGGVCNAWNTAYMEARGKIFAILEDLAWLSPNYVERTVYFYTHVRPTAFLAYRQVRCSPRSLTPIPPATV